MKNNIAVDEWLVKLPLETQSIVKKLIAMACRNMRGAQEFIYHDAVGYSVSDSPFDRICYIAPQKKGYVNFGFFFGAGLPDPKKLLVGEGKRLRHVKIWSVEDAANPALAKLVAAAWKEAPKRVDETHAARRKGKL